MGIMSSRVIVHTEGKRTLATCTMYSLNSQLIGIYCCIIVDGQTDGEVQGQP